MAKVPPMKVCPGNQTVKNSGPRNSMSALEKAGMKALAKPTNLYKNDGKPDSKFLAANQPDPGTAPKEP